jgi:hypothetical protein
MKSILIELTPIVGIALEVISGAWGNDEERVKRLKEQGYDVNRVQSCVNELMKIIQRYKD